MTWNPWKLTALALALMIATAVTTGLVVASWPRAERAVAVAPPPVDPAKVDASASPPRAPRQAETATAPRRTAAAGTPTAHPSPAVVQACNQTAAEASRKDRTLEVVKDVAIGAAAGAALGAAGGAIADGGKGAGKGAAIGSIVGAGGGTLYGLNENHKNDERYREAYASCIRARGHAG